jgi:two-component system OmpR family sensor kinase/two-component system sensor histidine kinase BaeS
VFARLVFVFGAFITLIMGGMALSVGLVRLLVHAGQPVNSPPALIGMGLLMLLGIAGAAIHVGRRAFKTVASPLADLMAAAEAVTAGDLSARVPEDSTGRFNGVMHTFNTMVASLERADQQRRNLTADVAHELRTPLQIIQGNLEGVLDDVYAPTPEHIEATLEATHQLARLVEDLRTLSLAESGQLPLDIAPVDVAELLLDTQTSFSGLAENAGLDLRVVLPNGNPTDAPLIVHGDPGRLDQVLANLVVNAVHHTPLGGIITLQADPMPDNIAIQVHDTGEGIAPEDLPFIFDRFWRGDRARTHQEGTGSGLGLAITRQLVRLHGGTIDVASTPGQGTTFTIRLPMAPPASER